MVVKPKTSDYALGPVHAQGHREKKFIKNHSPPPPLQYCLQKNVDLLALKGKSGMAEISCNFSFPS